MIKKCKWYKLHNKNNHSDAQKAITDNVSQI